MAEKLEHYVTLNFSLWKTSSYEDLAFYNMFAVWELLLFE